ncbi:MAG: tRNA uridine-5-carboxymethylaminomethyl(34) synthesis GTPase MnmE [Thalassovita sp.]
MDTIFALATAQGKAGVAVIRISGPDAHVAGTKLAGSLPAARSSALRVLRNSDGVRLDEALVLVFENKASFTGEPVVELQLHGSVAVVAAVLRELGQHDGLRQAEPGEFTRRALENGRLDLAQVEGLADLIESETEAQRRQALRVLSGDLGDKAESWRRDLIRAASLIEATIDFADEDIPVDVSPEVNALLDRVTASLETEVAGVDMAERVRSGFEVAIVGAPNVGKSTLLNALAGRDAAITSEFAGTTRDVIEVRMNLAGLPVTMLDTAGLRETEDKIEEIGIARAKERATSADLRVFLVEQGQGPDFEPIEGDIVLRAKADLLDDTTGAVSGLSGAGVTELVTQISNILSERTVNIGLATRERHRVAMSRAVIALAEARILISSDDDLSDIAAEELRTAVRALDSLVGRIDVEILLDEIFASFCLGK